MEDDERLELLEKIRRAKRDHKNFTWLQRIAPTMYAINENDQTTELFEGLSPSVAARLRSDKRLLGICAFVEACKNAGGNIDITYEEIKDELLREGMFETKADGVFSFSEDPATVEGDLEFTEDNIPVFIDDILKLKVTATKNIHFFYSKC